MRKLGPITWSKDVTLGSLWQQWMDLNGFNLESAQRSLLSVGIRGGDNLPQWLNNTPSVSMLTTNFRAITTHTGIDIDGWMVCEAKRQVLEEHPELVDRISFDRMTTRESYCDELDTWRKLYGAELYLSIQLEIPRVQVKNWVQRQNYPSLEAMKRIIHVLAVGILAVDSREDLIFTLICRCCFNEDPITIFEVATFRQACISLLKPFRGHTPVRKEKELHLNRQVIVTIEKYIEGETVKFPLETIENVIAELLRRSYPNHYDGFIQQRSLYRICENEGIWKVPVQINLHDEPRPDQWNMQPLPVPDPPVAEVKQEDPPASRNAFEYVEQTHKPEPPPAQTEPSEAVPGPQEDLFQILSQVFSFGAHKFRQAAKSKTKPKEPAIPISVAEQIGTEIEGVRQCLDQASYKATDGRLTPDQVEQIRALIERLRGLLVLTNRLDRQFVRETLKPALGPELFELFLAGQGLEHLLHTPEAWQIVAAQRESANFNRKLKGN